MNSAGAGLWIAALILPLGAQEPTATGVNFYSVDREVQIGRETAAGLEGTLRMVRAHELDAYLARLGADLAAHADRQFRYRFLLYDDRRPIAVPTVVLAMPANAFRGQAREPVAIGGGPIFVPLSLLTGASDEPAFALQLAHAMVHIALRHPSRQATREQLAILGHAPLTTEARPGSIEAIMVAASENPALQLSLAALTRQFEVEANTQAAAMVAAAGYSAAEPSAATGQFAEIKALAAALP